MTLFQQLFVGAKLDHFLNGLEWFLHNSLPTSIKDNSAQNII